MATNSLTLLRSVPAVPVSARSLSTGTSLVCELDLAPFSAIIIAAADHAHLCGED